MKLRKKITSTVQVLTHVKEKLQFVQAENQVQKGNLKEVEATVAQVNKSIIGVYMVWLPGRGRSGENWS